MNDDSINLFLIHFGWAATSHPWAEVDFCKKREMRALWINRLPHGGDEIICFFLLSQKLIEKEARGDKSTLYIRMLRP